MSVTRFALPLAAVAGALFAVVTVVRGSRPTPVADPVALPAVAPFAAFVAGAGLIEANTENIAIGTPVSGLVTEVGVAVGDAVKKGDALFVLDERPLRAELEVRRAALAAARARLEKLRLEPRPEDLPPLEARVAEARALLEEAKRRLELAEAVTDRRAVSEEQMSGRRFAVLAAESRLAEAESALALAKAGAWAPDLAIARADVASAEALLRSAEIELDRLTVRAPVDGRVLRLNVRAGEFATAGHLETPLLVLGGVDPLHVRIDVDENDAWRMRAGAPAEAFVRGNAAIKTPLRFVRFEPYVIPKRSLTGESTERVDTRVLQAIYAFDRGDLPVFVGQQMDVFIDASEAVKP